MIIVCRTYTVGALQRKANATLSARIVYQAVPPTCCCQNTVTIVIVPCSHLCLREKLTQLFFSLEKYDATHH